MAAPPFFDLKVAVGIADAAATGGGKDINEASFAPLLSP